MKVLFIVLSIYTVVLFWFGAWVQRRSDNAQVRALEEAAFSDGCHKCAQFEIMQCQRDNTLQGQEGFTQIP